MVEIEQRYVEEDELRWNNMINVYKFQYNLRVSSAGQGRSKGVSLGSVRWGAGGGSSSSGIVDFGANSESCLFLITVSGKKTPQKHTGVQL